MNDVRITVTGQSGVRVLPRDNESKYVIRELGIGHLSSIRIDYVGPYDQSVYQETPKHRAPPAQHSERVIESSDVQELPHVLDAATHVGLEVEAVEPTSRGEPEQENTRVMQSQGDGHAGSRGDRTAEELSPSVAGVWNSSLGRVYHIAQVASHFEWGVENSPERAFGHIENGRLFVRWEGPRGEGEAEGFVTEMDGEHRATRIEWTNGVKFFRE